MKRMIAMALACLMALAVMGAALAETASLEDVMAAFELDDEMMALEEEDLLDVYGIEPEDVAQFAAAINETGIKADEIVLVEATDDEAAARVLEALEERYQDKLNELEDYLPEEYAVVKACAVESDGRFVAMIVSPDAASLTAIYEESIR